MSETDVHFIIGRAVTDPEYRELLIKDPDTALEGIDLTEEEALLIRGIGREDFTQLAGELEQRISRAGLSVQEFSNRLIDRMDLGQIYRSLYILACPSPPPVPPIQR